MSDVRCTGCGQGVLEPRKAARFGTAAASIGGCLLFISTLGLATVLFLVVLGGRRVVDLPLSPDTLKRLHETKVPPNLIAELNASRQLPPEAKRHLRPDQAEAVAMAEAELALGGVMGPRACGSIAVVLGAVGLLLIRTRSVLVCSACLAVTEVPAS